MTEVEEGSYCMLLDKGANVNASDVMGITPLMYAAQKGHENCISALMSSGADVKAVTQTGKTALMYAKEAKHKGCVNLFRRAGTEPTCCSV